MSEVTGRQRQILEFIRDTTADRGYPPSVREIGEAVGLNSPSSVHAQLATLAEKGYLAKDAARPRTITLRMDSSGIPVGERPVEHIPVIGRIAAGAPILATENVEDSVPLPRDMLGSGTLFALKVKGDSMTGAGILDGDLVIIRSQPQAENGEIVAALVDGEEATVKRLSRKRARLQLLPENPAYDPIESEDVQILGKVVGVFRSRV
ncbi:MAG: transcriptional repressor LexA [Actinomycetota bacterium]